MKTNTPVSGTLVDGIKVVLRCRVQLVKLPYISGQRSSAFSDGWATGPGSANSRCWAGLGKGTPPEDSVESSPWQLMDAVTAA